MQIQWKVILVVFLAIVGITSAAVWKTRALVTEDKINSLTDSNIKQIAPLRKLVETKLEDEKETLIGFASQAVTLRAIDSRAKGNAFAFGDFDIVSLVVPNDSGSWTPSWIEHNPALATGGAEDRFPNGYDLTLLKSLSYSKLKNGEVIWTRLSDRQGLPIYAVMMSVEVLSDVRGTKNSVGNSAIANSKSELKSDSALPETTEYGRASESTSASGSSSVSGNGARGTSHGDSGTQAVVVGFATGNPLASVTEDYIGSTHAVYLVDERGYVASHNNRGYLGALFSEDPVAKEIIKSQKSEGTGRFEDLESQHVLSHYERIDGTNLYAVISTPVAAVTSFVDILTRMTLITATLAGLAALLLAWFVGQNISESIERLSIAVQNVVRGGSPSSFQVLYSKGEIGRLSAQFAEALRAVEQHTSRIDSSAARTVTTPDESQVVGASKIEKPNFGNLDPFGLPPMMARGADSRLIASSALLNDQASDRTLPASAQAAVDRRAAYEAFSEGLNDLIKQPLMSILGHVQLTRAKTDDPEVRAHIESIEREARRVRETMDRLRDFEAAPVALEDSQTMHLDHVVASALESAAQKLEADDTEVDRQVQVVPEIRGDSIQMQAALSHVIENAREAVKDQPVKKITVRILDQGGNLVIEVKDSGIGMSRDIQQKAFDPFFKNFDSPARLGLGLAFVASAVKRIGAKVEIESSPGEGTLVRFSYPVTPTERASFDAAKSIAARAESFNQRVDDMWTATGVRADLDSQMAEGTLGGRAAVDLDAATQIFPPMPARKAEEMQLGDPAAHADALLGNLLSNSSSGGAVAHSAATRTAPQVPKQPPAGASSVRAPANVREQRLANAMESIAAAASFFDDEEEVFSNVPIGQAMSTMNPLVSSSGHASTHSSTHLSTQASTEKDADARGPSGDGLESGSRAGFKVKIRKPRVKS